VKHGKEKKEKEFSYFGEGEGHVILSHRTKKQKNIESKSLTKKTINTINKINIVNMIDILFDILIFTSFDDSMTDLDTQSHTHTHTHIFIWVIFICADNRHHDT